MGKKRLTKAQRAKREKNIKARQAIKRAKELFRKRTRRREPIQEQGSDKIRIFPGLGPRQDDDYEPE